MQRQTRSTTPFVGAKNRRRSLSKGVRLSFKATNSSTDEDNETQDEAPLDPRGGTNYPPKTEGKIKVMKERLQNGWQIFHPDDAKGETNPLTKGTVLGGCEISQSELFQILSGQ